MTAVDGKGGKAVKFGLLFCNICVFGLSVFGLLRGLFSLIISIVLLVMSGVGMWGIWKERRLVCKVNYGLYALWILLYILFAVLSFLWIRPVDGGINIAFALFGGIGGFLNHKYVKMLESSPADNPTNPFAVQSAV